MLQELVRNLIKTDKKILADTFVSTFLYANRQALILRFHNQQDSSFGIKKGDQRWSRCIVQYLSRFMYPAHIFMYEQKRNIWDRTSGDFNRDLIDERVDIVGSAEKFIREAVDEFKMRFKVGTNLKPRLAIDILNKLKTMKIIVSLQSDIFTTENLEEFYDELQLNGNEEYLESIWKMKNYHQKILNEPLASWRRQIDRMVYAQNNNFITYNIQDGNILYIPPWQMIYPNYHPLRPRFFNMVTIFQDVIARIHQGIQIYIQKKYKLQFYERVKMLKENNIQIAYEHYNNWLKNHTDLVLGANLLTHRQLYWVATAVYFYVRLQKTIPKDYYPKQQLRQEYLHVWFKNFNGFQEAFQCNITVDELKQVQEHNEKLYENY